MNVISRYMLKQFSRILGLSLLALAMVFLIVDFFEKVDNFMEAGLPMSKVFYFFLLSIPSIIFYIAPVSVLVAVLVSMGLMARNSEIVAFKAGGVSLFRLSRPIILASVLMSFLLFLLSDLVIPNTAVRVNEIWNVEVEGNKAATTHIHKDIWFRDANGVYNIKVYDEKLGTLEGISVYLFRSRFRLEKRIEAARAHKMPGGWLFADGMIKTYSENGEIEIRSFTRELIELPELPTEIGKEERASEELSSGDLREWIDRMEEGGYDPLKYMVDLQLKYSFPFICVIMAIIGLPIAFWKEKGGGIALGIFVGVGLSFVYVVLLGLSRALGYSGLLPPIVAAWLPNLMFTTLGLFLFTNVKQ